MSYPVRCSILQSKDYPFTHRMTDVTTFSSIYHLYYYYYEYNVSQSDFFLHATMESRSEEFFPHIYINSSYPPHPTLVFIQNKK